MKAKKLSGIPVVCSPCPLTSALNFPHATKYTRRCVEIIEQSRHTWGYYSDEYKSCCYDIVDGEEVPKKFSPYPALKLTSALSIQRWYTERSDLFLTCQKTPEAIKQAIREARRYARPGIDNDITDKEILAVFAICEALEAVKKIQRGGSSDAVNEKILSASNILKLAKAGFEPATRDTTKNQGGVIPLPVPPKTQWQDIKISFIDNEYVTITIKGKNPTKLNYAEMGFKNKKTARPVKSWVFLKMLASLNGRFDTYTHTKKDALEKSISDLRRTLGRLFNIEGDPIPYSKRYCNVPGQKVETKNPKKRQEAGYFTVFAIEDKLRDREQYEETIRQQSRVYPKKKPPTIRKRFRIKIHKHTIKTHDSLCC